MNGERGEADETAAAFSDLGVQDKANAQEPTSATQDEEPGTKEDSDLSGSESNRPANGTAASDRPMNSQKVVTKFLMSNAAAGSIIGKAGANITELQNQSSARLQLSRANEFFPGTEDRVLICSGTVDQIMTAVHLVLTRVQTELATADNVTDQDKQKISLRLLLPSALCGVLIGKGGATIRSFAQDSGAAIMVSAQNAQLPGVSDRVVRISGLLSQLMRALALILSKLVDSPHYARLASVPVNYSPAPGQQLGWGRAAMMPIPPMSARGHEAVGPPQLPTGPGIGSQAEIMIPVPDVRVGAVIGKGGEIITQLKTLVGVKIRISDRDNFVPGTRDRKVHISGTPEAVQIAGALIHQKVAAAAVPSRGQ